MLVYGLSVLPCQESEKHADKACDHHPHNRQQAGLAAHEWNQANAKQESRRINLFLDSARVPREGADVVLCEVVIISEQLSRAQTGCDERKHDGEHDDENDDKGLACVEIGLAVAWIGVATGDGAVCGI